MVAKNWPDLAKPIIRAYATASRAAISMERAAVCAELRQRIHDLKKDLRAVVARRSELGSDNVSKMKAQLQSRVQQTEAELLTAEALADAAKESCKSRLPSLPVDY